MIQYTGNPAATQAPSPPPDLNATAPIITLPQDGVDGVTMASLAQNDKTAADFIAFAMLKLSGLYKMTRTVVGLYADGAGDNSTSPAAGTIRASGLLQAPEAVLTTAQSATSTPTPTVVKGGLWQDNVPLAWVTVTGSSGAIKRGFNINSVTRNSAGVWTVAFNQAASASTDLCPVVTCIGTVPQILSAQLLSSSSIKVFSCGAFGGGTPTDTDFSLVLFSGT